MGAFVKARREELGLSQGAIIQALGYRSRNTVSNVEVGIEGLPAKRIYAWADVLDVPRDAFFRFATGEAQSMEEAGQVVRDGQSGPLTAAERELLEVYLTFRRLCRGFLRVSRPSVRAAESMSWRLLQS